MNDEVLALIDKLAGEANALARIYEDLATEWNGFASAAEYEEHARDAFEADMESIDAEDKRP
jgi:hypothetical protein